MIRLNYIGIGWGTLAIYSVRLDDLYRQYGFQASSARGYRNTHWLAIL